VPISRVGELEGRSPGWLLCDSCRRIRVPVLTVDEAERDGMTVGEIDLLREIE
jgi:hypothetical protein